MAILETKVLKSSPDYQTNREDMLSLLDDCRSAEGRVRDNSNSKKGKFEKRNQMLPRDRLALLLDRGAPFIELSSLAGYGMHDDDGKDDVCGGSSITGIGFVSGVRCMVYVHDSAIKGGAVPPMGVKKALRAQEVALENKLPMVTLAESAGANLQYQSELFVDGGRTFANQAKLSAAGLPQITVVHGSSTAGGAYVPGMSDYVIMVREKAKVFLAGPPLVKAATGEDANDEELGGADMHYTKTGLAEFIANDDAEAISHAREVMASLNWNRQIDAEAQSGFEEPLYDIDELCGVVPPDYRKPYDCREIIARLVDGSDFTEFKSGYGSEIVAGTASVMGYRVGIIGNNGPIYPAGSVKAAQFMQLCCQSQTPLLFLQNTTGFMVGKQVEEDGMVKHGSKMIQAVATANVPKITFLIGAAFGAGHYAMCGRSYDPRFIFAWPNNRVAVMGGEQAAGVMRIIAEQKFQKMGIEINEEVSEQLDGAGQVIVDQIDRESTALFSTAHLWDDGIIDPRDSRRLLGELLSVCQSASQTTLNPNSFGVARM
ncbi:MAG: acetyl-CoA carboxylase carboxyltransferase subunit [Myxococcales bacterium]|nr:acetyl-CoA carboxylase carboxyltransferase subunit [Myxococcales bacterium]